MCQLILTISDNGSESSYIIDCKNPLIYNMINNNYAEDKIEETYVLQGQGRKRLSRQKLIKIRRLIRIQRKIRSANYLGMWNH